MQIRINNNLHYVKNFREIGLILDVINGLINQEQFRNRSFEVSLENISDFIGLEYKPYDNSYCINLRTKEESYIVQNPDDEGYIKFCLKKEKEAKYTIISYPYIKLIEIFDKKKFYIFINVKSSITGNIYRTLFSSNIIIDKNLLQL